MILVLKICSAKPVLIVLRYNILIEHLQECPVHEETGPQRILFNIQ